MSQIQTIIPDDNEVSRIMAEKAMHDQAFRIKLFEFVGSQVTTSELQKRPKKFQWIVQIIAAFRKQIADQVGLEAPLTQDGAERDISTYLRQASHSEGLVTKADAQMEPGFEVIDGEGDHSWGWGWVGPPMCVARLALAFLQSTLRFQADPTPFPFERLPAELRLLVYREVLRGLVRRGFAYGEKIVVACNKHSNNHFAFRLGDHQKGESKGIDIGLLATNKLVTSEAIPVFYQMYIFEFTTYVGGVVPFLSSLSEGARQNLRGISMELHDKRETDYCCGGLNNSWGRGGDNKAAWGRACKYIAENVNMKELSLTINVKVHEDFKSLQWVKGLIKIKNLKRLTLQANQHYPNGQLLTQASYKEGSLLATKHCFSKHLVPLFEYLREDMLE